MSYESSAEEFDLYGFLGDDTNETEDVYTDETSIEFDTTQELLSDIQYGDLFMIREAYTEYYNGEDTEFVEATENNWSNFVSTYYYNRDLNGGDVTDFLNQTGLQDLYDELKDAQLILYMTTTDTLENLDKALEVGKLKKIAVGHLEVFSFEKLKEVEN